MRWCAIDEGRARDEADAARGPSGDTHSELSGAAGDVVQARDVSGGVHFHHTGAPYTIPEAPTPRQLPADIGGFVHREAELRRLDAVMDVREGASPARCVVIAGTPGVGKTALALRWAHQAADRFPDGQLYVNLRGHAAGEPLTPGEVLHRFLLALGVPAPSIPADPESAAGLYRSYLADRRALIVLDNAGTVGQVRPLLPGGAHCLTLVTSRHRLSGLAVRDGAHRIVLDRFTDAESVALLGAVTAGARRGDDADRLGQLAGLCGGLPLALRIAAEKAVSHPHLRLDDLIEELRDESSLWTALSTGDEEEAEAVRTVFAWSYRDLPPSTARVFRLLGLHPGPEFSLHAAAALAGGTVSGMRQTLDTLVGDGLLGQTAPDRFEFHDLLRAYAADRARTDEPESAREAALRRALTWYLRTAGGAHERLQPDEAPLPLVPADDAVVPLSFTDYDQAMDWYAREQANIQAAVTAAAGAGLDAFTWQLPLLMWSNYAPTMPYARWIDVARLGVAASRRLGNTVAEARLLACMGEARSSERRFAESEEFQREALDIRRAVGDRRGEAGSLNALGLVCLRGRELAAAEDWFTRAAEVFAELGDTGWVATVRANLAEAHCEADRLTEAAAAVDGALETHRASGNRRGEGAALRVLSAVLRERGEPEAALAAARESVEIAVQMRHRASEGFRLLTLGHAQCAAGQFAEALASFHRTASIYRRIGDRFCEAQAWYGAAKAHQLRGHDGDAAAFHRRAAAAFHDLADPWNEALALVGLASALGAADPDQARRCRVSARDLLAGYRDPRAVGLRTALVRRLAQPPGAPESPGSP